MTDKKPDVQVGPPKPQDWSTIMKGATPEDVARALLRPLTPRRPDPPKK